MSEQEEKIIQEPEFQQWADVVRADERERIVSWLRKQAEEQAGPWKDLTDYTHHAAWRLANAIEKGEYLEK